MRMALYWNDLDTFTKDYILSDLDEEEQNQLKIAIESDTPIAYFEI